MLKLRIITAVVLAAVSLWAIYGWPTLLFGLFLLVATACCAYEWSSLLNIESPVIKYTYIGAATVITALLLWLDNTEWLRAMALIAVLCWIAILLDLILRPVIARVEQVRPGLLLLATFILVTTVVSLYWMREHYSAHVIVYVIALVAAADIG
ncbi:MAG: phosphatidate cytidylyltransferase, partial [Pseudomonadota bacterium]